MPDNITSISATIDALMRLAETLKDLNERGSDKELVSPINFPLSSDNDQESSVDEMKILPISFYRSIPDEVAKAYKLMEDAAELISASSTKFTLVERINENDGHKLVAEMLRGAEIIATGALVIHSSNMGLGRSARYYAKHSSRAVVASLISLFKSFDAGTARIRDSSVGAQKTGVVWQCCGKVRKIPKGNRNAMRRDLLQWIKDCNDTWEEFREMIDAPAVDAENIDDINWDEFCVRSGEQFTKTELRILQPCVALVKCSRGTISAILKSCDDVGKSIASIEEKKDIHYLWISSLHELARIIGEGVTELGSMLYPPLEIDDDGLVEEIKSLSCALKKANQAILEMSEDERENCIISSETSSFARKLIVASAKRSAEALKDI